MSRVRQDVVLLTVSELMREIDATNLALADFQRDFDWSDRDARALFATLLMGWPAGSVLLLRGERSGVASRPFSDGPQTPVKPALMVLDGQQRLTAVFHGLLDVGPVVHVIAASSVMADDVEVLEDGMRTFPRFQWDSQLRQSPWRANELYIPLYALRSSEAFFSYRDLAEATRPPSASPDSVSLLQRAWRHRLGRLNDYHFPVVLIEPEAKSDVDDGAVARIFERVNRTGQRLGAFDLVVARTYRAAPAGGNLRDLWDEARLSDALLDSWLGDDGLREDGMPMLQAIALTQPPSDVRQAAVLDLEPSLITREWPRAVAAVQSTLRFLNQRCGVARPDWLPYRASLITLAGLAMEHDLFANAAIVEQWFWTRTFSLRFDAAANTRTTEEFFLLRSAVPEQRLPGIEPVRANALSRATRRRFQALYRGLLCLLVARRAEDLLGKRIVMAGPDEVTLDDDVVISTLLPRVAGDDVHLRAIGMALTTRETASLLRHQGVIIDALAPRAVSSQLIPDGRTEEPDRWIEERVTLVCDELLQRADQPRIDSEPG